MSLRRWWPWNLEKGASPTLKFFWYCLVCTSEYAEARVEACVEVVSVLPAGVGIELYLNDTTAGQLGLAQSGSNGSPEEI